MSLLRDERRLFALDANQAHYDALRADGWSNDQIDAIPPREWPAPVEFDEEFADVPFLPVAHYGLPNDPSKRTALCNRSILGVPTGDIEFVMCPDCAALAAWLDGDRGDAVGA